MSRKNCPNKKCEFGQPKYKLKIYRVLDSMKLRCYDENHDSYKYYGGRGITIYNEWLSDSSSFIRYCYNLYPNLNDLLNAKYRIDRIKNNGNYEPGNIRFISNSDNVLNSSRALTIKIGKKELPLLTYLRQLGLESKSKLIYSRLSRFKQKTKSSKSQQNQFLRQVIKELLV